MHFTFRIMHFYAITLCNRNIKFPTKREEIEPKMYHHQEIRMPRIDNRTTQNRSLMNY